MLNEKINVINVGTDVFCDAIKQQGIDALQLNWKPTEKKELSKRAKEILDKTMYSDFKIKIEDLDVKHFGKASLFSENPIQSTMWFFVFVENMLQ